MANWKGPSWLITEFSRPTNAALAKEYGMPDSPEGGEVLGRLLAAARSTLLLQGSRVFGKLPPFVGGRVIQDCEKAGQAHFSGREFMARHTSLLIAISCLMVSLAGCHFPWKSGLAGQHPGHEPPLPNPLFVPVRDPEVLWTQLLDVLDNDFKVQREERVRVVGDLMLEGRIETFPTDGSTILEPWRKDSTHGFEKWHATLQSLRRRVAVRVIPADGGFLVDLMVQKELEALNQPENSDVARMPLPDDGPRTGRQEETREVAGVTSGWIPIGRDASLEQRLLRDLQARLTQ